MYSRVAILVLMATTLYLAAKLLLVTTRLDVVGFRLDRSRVGLELARELNAVMRTLQGSTCVFVKAAWANMRPQILLQAGGKDISCQSQMAVVLQIIRGYVTNLDLAGRISAAEAIRVEAAMEKLVGKIFDLTCLNGVVDIAKAVALMDKVVSGFCE